ncbi:MAG: Zn-dependent hydrolase [Acidobacteriota bacterium]|nr:Zn-dependent hydrolase [Acidobacteriota bacterium]MDW3226221.1 Zn-dependent hydrolase [Acidobacteriota bacterium]
MIIRINASRLQSDLEALGRIGRDAAGGITRPSFSRADLEARVWLRSRIEEAGLEYREDGAGNQFGRLEGASGPEASVVMAGSHLDTVPNGGMFDGAAGVVAALECLRTIREEGLRLRLPLEAASFTDEEGNLVGDFLGSRAFTGKLDRELLERGTTSFGPPLADILSATPYTIETILSAAGQAPAVAAYLELHIEQGPVLETEGISLGLVETINGKHYRWCAFEGESGHSGTVPLELRRDALLGLADFALRATRHVASAHYGSFVTIGRALIQPGTFSSIPRRADFSLEFRSSSKESMEALERELLGIAGEVASARRLRFASRLMDRTDPYRIPGRLAGILAAEADGLGYAHMPVTSGAGHDAQILGTVTDAAMIFIPSPDGLSHAPEESLRWEDLEKGANLLLAALLRLAS